jgi:hypothetical protein
MSFLFQSISSTLLFQSISWYSYLLPLPSPLPPTRVIKHTGLSADLLFGPRSTAPCHRDVLLQVRNIEANAMKELVDGQGYPLPPFIVMERGESLDVWAARAQPDRALAFAVRLPTTCTNQTWYSMSISAQSCVLSSCTTVLVPIVSTSQLRIKAVG